MNTFPSFEGVRHLFRDEVVNWLFVARMSPIFVGFDVVFVDTFVKEWDGHELRHCNDQHDQNDQLDHVVECIQWVNWSSI